MATKRLQDVLQAQRTVNFHIVQLAS